MGIYIWGTGCGASELIEAGLNRNRIAAFVDSFPMGATFLDRPVLLPEQLPVDDCDLLIIDDLGTEPMMRNITVEYLFTLLNERNAAKRHGQKEKQRPSPNGCPVPPEGNDAHNAQHSKCYRHYQ